jgi:hypothetical protein
MADLNDIITSRVRVKVLELFFGNVREMYHVRGIVRAVNEEINSVRRELKRFEKAGILKSEYYSIRSDYEYYGDLLSIVAKTTGLGKEININIKKIGRVSFIMFSGRFVRRKSRKKDDDVDILVVGDIVLPELAAVVRKEESKREQEINYTVMSRDELIFRKKRRDPFLQGILSGSRVMIVGDEEDLVS